MDEVIISDSILEKLTENNVKLDDLKSYIDKHKFSFAICEDEEDQEYLMQSYEYKREYLE